MSRLFALENGEEYEPVIYLTAGTAQALAPVVVAEKANRLSGFEERRLRGFGAFMTREEIERRGATTPIELLRGMPGVIVRRGAGQDVPISTRGTTAIGEGGVSELSYGCRMAVYIDGVLFSGEYLATAIRPSEIDGIEVYAGAAEIPAQFKPGNNGCGAILIWSRKE